MRPDRDLSPELRFQALLEKTMERMEEMVEDREQFNRILIKVKTDPEQEEQTFRLADTKALKEFVAGLKELKAMLPGQAREDTGVRVIFEAGEDAFNE